MKNKITLLTFLFNLLFLISGFSQPPSHSSIAYLSRPAFKMYGITSGPHPTMSDAQLKTFSEAFYLIHGWKYTDRISYMKGINPDIKFLEYMNSTYVWNVLDNYDTVEEFGVVETHNKHAVAMTPVAWINAAITESETTFQLYRTNPANAAKLNETINIPIAASTVSGNYSATDLTGNTNFVFWIRIGNELMKVVNFSTSTGQITVTRGFNGTSITSHPSGSLVFCPLYIGSYAPTKSNKGLRYALDPRITDANFLRGVRAVEIMNSPGMDGIWLDIYSPSFFNQYNIKDEAVKPWDFTKNAYYVRDDWRYFQELKATYFRDYVFEQTGKYPVIVGNNMTQQHYYEGQGGSKLYLMSTEVKPVPLYGMCNESLLYKAITSLSAWKEGLKMLLDAAKSNLACMPIMGDAGWNGQTEEWPDTPERDKKERFAYAFFLMAVPMDVDPKMLMGTYPFYKYNDANGAPFFKIHRQYYLPVGNPVETINYSSLTDFIVPGTQQVYKRQFSNALILINPGTITENVTLGDQYLDPDNETWISSISMPAGTGKILLINPFTDIKQQTTRSDIIFYPNPSHDKAILRMDYNLNGNNYYQLFDAGGRLRHKGPVTGNETIIPMDNLYAGIYYLRINTKAGVTEFVKLVKN